MLNEYHFPLKPLRSVLFLNGEKTKVAPIKKRLTHYEKMMVTDGAWNRLQKTALPALFLALTKKAPTVMGDGDSISDKPSHFIEAPNQDATDFEKIIKHMVGLAIDSADVYWASNGEVDHFLGNLSVAAKYHDKIKLHFFDSTHTYFYLNQGCRLVGAKGKKMSIYPFPECRISSHGLTYEMTQWQLKQNTQQSLRNQINSESAVLQLQGAAFVFVENKR